MKCPGFWINLHPYPDKIILDNSHISALNRKTETEQALISDILNIGAFYPGEKLKDKLRKDLDHFLKGRFYNDNGKRVNKIFYHRIKENMRIDDIPSGVNVRYGFILRYTDQRILPTDEIITETPFDTDFDEIQNSSLDAGTPLALLHETRDKKWYYVVTSSSLGWINKDSAVVCSHEQMKNYFRKDFCVVTAAKTGIFLDSSLTQYYDYARMGMKFALNRYNEDFTEILIPFHDDAKGFYERKAYLKRQDVHIGFLSYTPRVILEQAFKLLNVPYGWGGMNGEQDCSSFLQEIFAVTGIVLPRNSVDQAKIGTKIAEFKNKSEDVAKLSALSKEGIGGITLLQLKGHILLYLGCFNGGLYAIHETNGYRERVWWLDRVKILRRVVVSDLSLGEGSRKGSLLERLLVVIKVL